MIDIECRNGVVLCRKSSAVGKTEIGWVEDMLPPIRDRDRRYAARWRLHRSKKSGTIFLTKRCRRVIGQRKPKPNGKRRRAQHGHD